VTRVERKIRDEVEENNIPAFTTHLHERSAYKAMMVGTTLAELDPAEYNGIDKAIINSDLLAAELIENVMEIRIGRRRTRHDQQHVWFRRRQKASFQAR
jgi:chromosome partitioning protein